MFSVGVLSLIGCVTLFRPVAAADSDWTLRYAILMEKDKIGEETYHISTQGSVMRVDVTTDSQVSMLFFKYNYHHSHTEIWRDGKLDSYVADTNDDGEIHRIQAHRAGDSIVAIVDSKPEAKLPDGAAPFSIWNQMDMKRTSVFSIIDLDSMAVRADDKGSERVSMGGATIPAEHYRMSGDEVRDLWYGPDGNLLKTEFKHIGYHIAFVKE